MGETSNSAQGFHFVFCLSVSNWREIYEEKKNKSVCAFRKIQAHSELYTPLWVIISVLLTEKTVYLQKFHSLVWES